MITNNKAEFIERCHKRINCPGCNMELIRMEPYVKGKYDFWCTNCGMDVQIYDNDVYDNEYTYEEGSWIDEQGYPISTTIHEFLDFFDFRLEEYDDGYGVIDNQGTDLGNIEGERYKELWQIVERFNGSIYEQDYLVNDLEEEFGYDGDYSREDMYEFAKQKDIGYANVLYTMMYPQSVTE